MIPKGFIPSSGAKSFAIMGGSLECVNDVIRVMDEVVPVGAFHDDGQFGANSA